jgi:hypothetical protein
MTRRGRFNVNSLGGGADEKKIAVTHFSFSEIFLETRWKTEPGPTEDLKLGSICVYWLITRNTNGNEDNSRAQWTKYVKWTRNGDVGSVCKYISFPKNTENNSDTIC